MRKLFASLICFLLLTIAVAAPAPSAPSTVGHAPQPKVPLEEYFKTRRVGSREGILMSFSYDERLVAYLSDEGGRTDVWVQPVEGGTATQITHVKGFVEGLAFSPTADQLVYASDMGGDELPHLFMTDSKGTAARDLIPEQASGRRTDFVEWADDGKSFLFLSSLRDEKFMDLYEYNVSTGKYERLWEGSGKLAFGKASRDHQRFIITEEISDADSNLYLVDRGQKGPPKLLTEHKGKVLYNPVALSRDGKTLFFTSDEGGEFTALITMDLQTQKMKDVARPNWDVEDGGFSHAWKYFFYTTNVDGQTQLSLSDTKTNQTVPLPATPQGGAWVPITASRSDRFLGVRLQTDTAPATPYVIDMKTGTARRILDPLPPSLQNQKMVRGEVVHIPSFDNREVPAFLYRPQGAGPFPAIIDVHGGPTSQSTRDFGAFRQYLVSKGYVVLVPNVRGSTGYGKSYARLDNHDLGGGPLKDIIACKKWLVKEANVDNDKVVVMGGSYGGYMALSAATFAPTEFAALVDFFGVSDLKTLVESFPAYWASDAPSIYEKFGDPKNPADTNYQHDRSPIFFVDKIVRPLLIVQGDHDSRVKKDQSDRIVEALQKRHVPVSYLILKDEGHGFSKNSSILSAYGATDRFLDHFLFGDTSRPILSP